MVPRPYSAAAPLGMEGIGGTLAGGVWPHKKAVYGEMARYGMVRWY